MACDDVGVFVHEGKLLLLPKSRGNSSHVCVLYPETGRYQLYTLDNLSKVSVAPLCLWSERERERGEFIRKRCDCTCVSVRCALVQA